MDRVFLIQWVIAFNSYMAMSALGVFAIERAVVTTEIANGMYSAFHYVIANAVVQVRGGGETPLALAFAGDAARADAFAVGCRPRWCL